MNRKRIRQMNTALLRRLTGRSTAEYFSGQPLLERLESENYIQRFAPLYDGTRLRCGDVLELWERILKDYDELVYIPMSSGLSSSCETAVMLAQDYGGRVQVVNNQRISVTLRQSAPVSYTHLTLPTNSRV